MSFELTWALVSSRIIGYILLVCLIYAISMAVNTVVFQLLLHFVGVRVSYAKAAIVVTIGTFINHIAPLKTGNILGKPLVGRALARVPMLRAVSVNSFQHFLDWIWQLTLFPILLVLLGEKVFFYNNVVKWSVVLVLAILVGITAYKFKWFLPHALRMRNIIPESIRDWLERIGVSRSNMEELIHALPKYFSKKWVVGTVVVGLTIDGILLPFILWAALSYFSVSLSYFTIFALYWVSYTIGRLSLLPGGIGVKDVTLAALLVGVGVSGNTAVQVVIIFRALSIIPPMIFGGGLILLFRKELWQEVSEMIRTLATRKTH